MNQPKPKLPYYFRTSRRLKSLDEFEAPAWKRRMRFASDDKVTLAGVARETLRFLALFAIIGIVGGALWIWLGADGCADLPGGFKLGWC